MALDYQTSETIPATQLVSDTSGRANLTPDTNGLGYSAGGGSVTQITSRTTEVTLSKLCGKITTDTSSLAGLATAKFTVTNTLVEVDDVVVACIRSGSNSGGTSVAVTTVAAGSFEIAVQNNNAAAGTAETGAIIINFAVIKAVVV